MNTKHTFKKALSALLVLMMVLSSMTILPMTVSAESNALAATDAVRESMAPAWNGSAKTAAADFKGSGTESDPLQIRSGADLQGLADAAKATDEAVVYVKLMNDINMNGKQFTQLATFNVDFDGNDKVIYNLAVGTANAGKTAGSLFEANWNNTYISFHDVSFVKAAVYSSNQGGIIVGYSTKGVYKFDNIYTSGTVVSTSTDGQAGGLIGYLGAADKLEITNCVNDANVTAARRASGIISRHDSNNGSVVIRNCVNNGTMTTTANFAGFSNSSAGNVGGAAGILGGVFDGAAAVEVIIEDCVNNGEIKATGVAGGIVADLAVKGNLLIKGCTNKGIITSTNAAYVGGVLAFGHFTDTDATATIYNCKNTQSVTGLATTGGVVGVLNTTAATASEWNFRMEFCINTAAVNGALEASSTWRQGVAGILGGATSGSSSVDGGNVLFNGCVNQGAITSSGNNISGIVGGLWDLYAPHTYFYGCANTGTLKSTMQTYVYGAMGGIAGQIRAQGAKPYDQALTLNYCYDYSARDLSERSTSITLDSGNYRGLVAWNGDQIPTSLITISNSACCSKTGTNLTPYTHGTSKVSFSQTTAATIEPLIATLTAAVEATATLDGMGIEDAPYRLATRADLEIFGNNTKYFSSPVYAELTNTIDMSNKLHTPFSTSATISLDGNNYAIDGLTIQNVTHAGLFTGVGHNSTFKNIKLTNVNITATAQSAAALIGDASARNLTFSNIYVSGKITAPNNAGALMGANSAGNTLNTLKAEYCVNAADITANNAGGLFGYMSGSMDYDISYCANLGTLTATGDSVRVGGILAYAPRGTAFTTPTFSYCYNVGKLISTKTSNSYLGMAGILADIRVANITDGTQTSTLAMDHCYDMGKYTVASGKAAYGIYAGGDSSQFKSRTVSDCMVYSNCSAVTVTSAPMTTNNNVKVTDVNSADYAALVAAIDAIQAKIDEQTAPTLKLDNNMGLRMKLTEPFGMMTITNVTYNGSVLNVADYDTYFAEYGFIYYAVEADATAPTTDAIKADGYRVEGALYEENGATAGTRFMAAYDRLSASSLNRDIYIVSYVVIGGETYISDVVTYNPYEIATDLSDGVVDSTGAVIESDAEVKVYVKMVAYYDAYKAYLDSLK